VAVVRDNEFKLGRVICGIPGEPVIPDELVIADELVIPDELVIADELVIPGEADITIRGGGANGNDPISVGWVLTPFANGSVGSLMVGIRLGE